MVADVPVRLSRNCEVVNDEGFENVSGVTLTFASGIGRLLTNGGTVETGGAFRREECPKFIGSLCIIGERRAKLVYGMLGGGIDVFPKIRWEISGVKKVDC